MTSIDEEIPPKDEVVHEEKVEAVDAHLREDNRVSFKTWLVVTVSISLENGYPTL